MLTLTMVSENKHFSMELLLTSPMKKHNFFHALFTSYCLYYVHSCPSTFAVLDFHAAGQDAACDAYAVDDEAWIVLVDGDSDAAADAAADVAGAL